MIISERIFKRLKELSMSQKEFAEKTGIQPSTISEWKKKKANPSSDKIMAICVALDVTPEWLLSGVGPAGNRKNRQDYYIIDKNSELGTLIETYMDTDDEMRARMMGYLTAFIDISGGRKK
ncbi:MAG: helix-turn-helix transcriptional regulator [Lachnospiraceae bacterium]|nr:helix-turn-helix transcriptional regulator [Lachnospiraceae bacterium]